MLNVHHVCCRVYFATLKKDRFTLKLKKKLGEEKITIKCEV